MTTKYRFNLTAILILAVGSLLLSSCLKDKYKPDRFMKPNWEPGFGIPLATFNITLGNLLGDDSTLTINPDSSIKIVFRNDTIAQQSVGDFMEIPVQPPSVTSLGLGPIEIADFGSSQSVLLSSLLNNLSPATSSAISAAAAFGIPTPFPPIPEQGGGNYALPQINDFGEVTFSKGALNISIYNGFPTTLDSIVLELENAAVGGNPAVSLGIARFGNLTSGTSQTQPIVLAGQTMRNNINFNILKIASAGTAGNVNISLDSAITISMAGDSLEVVNGLVLIPSQDFSADTNRVNFATSDGGQELYSIDLSSGDLEFSFVSSIAEEIRVEIDMPSISVGGVPISRVISIQPNATTNEVISMAGATIDLTTDAQQPFNMLPVIVQASLIGSGSLVQIDSSNGLTVNYGFNNIEFSVVNGYFGRDTIEITPSTLDLNLSFLKDLGGSVFLSNPTIELLVTNSIGAEIEMTLDMEARTVDGQSVSLDAPAQTLPYPTTAGATASGSLNYSRDNSKLDSLLSLPPDTLRTGGRIILNPNGNTGTNFITSSGEIQIGMEADLPFELSASGIGFGDTSDFDAATTLNGVLAAKLRFRSENRFPFDLSVELSFLDSLDNEVHRINAPLVTAAQVDANGRVIAESRSTSEVELTKEAMPDIKRAKKLVLRLAMSTASGGQQVVKIYTDYDIKMTLGLEATARIGDLL